MNLKNTTIALAVFATVSTGMISCKSQEKKDAELKAKIEAATPNVSVTVKDGVATLSGEFADDATRMAAEEAAKKVEGVKSVVNNATVSAPVVVNPDQILIDGVNSAIKEFAGVQAMVNAGVVALSGEIKKADWIKLKQTIDAMRPKSVDSKSLVIK